MTRPRFLITSLIALAGLSAAAGANPGDLLWSYGRHMNSTGYPVAAAGRVYWNGTMAASGNAAGVVALTDSGQVIWETDPGVGDAGLLAVGGDGAVYVNSIVSGTTTLNRLSPIDGSIEWYTPIPDESYGILEGPSVGPDGNIYGVTSSPFTYPNSRGSLYSIAPDGSLRWTVTGFRDQGVGSGTYLGFSNDSVVVVQSSIPVQVSGFESDAGSISFGFDGVEHWHDLYSLVQNSVGTNSRQATFSAVTGLVHIANRYAGENRLRAYRGDGSVAWEYSGASCSPVIDAQGNLYTASNSQHLTSLSPQGVRRWSRNNAMAGQAGSFGITISPDGQYLAATIGACYGGSCPGRVYVFRTSDGSTLFNRPLPPQASGVSWGMQVPSFSPDGSKVYVTARTLPVYGSGQQDQQMSYLYAYEVAPTPPACGTGDFDGDGDIGTDADIEAFFACLAGNCCTTCYPNGADFNADGDAGTDQDIESFFRVLAGGNC